MSHRKIVIVGDAGVGKTNLVRFLKEVHFEKKYFATVGVEVHPYSFDEGPANYVI
jgi:GTP-binding nuclear protein Ran